MKMKDLDSMSVEELIRLPFFHSLERDLPDAGMGKTSTMWKITFMCNKTTPKGWQLLDELSDKEYIVRYKLIDFK